MTSPKITVYITSHNYSTYLKEAIESVLRQSTKNWELLLINNNSTDATQDIMELYTNDERIRLLHEEKKGIPACANLALREAKGEYLVRLDADDVFDENLLLVLGTYLDNNPTHALVFPDYFLMDAFGNVFAQERIQSYYNRNHVLDMPPNGACTMIRVDVLKDIGGYREDLNAQDGFDLWSKVRDKYKSGNVNIPLFYYRRHGENMTGNNVRILNARRQIKKDASVLNLNESRPIIAVIPCRKNYDMYPDLWSVDINGQTLLDIAIQKCLASDMFDHVVITSDNQEVKTVIDKYDDKRILYVERSTDQTVQSYPIASTLESVAAVVDKDFKGITVLTYLQAALTTTHTLEEAVSTIIINEADSSIAVEEIKDKLYRRDSHGLVAVNRQGHFISDFDTIYREVRTCVGFENKNLRKGSWRGAKTVFFNIPKEEMNFLHTKKDAEILRLLHSK